LKARDMLSVIRFDATDLDRQVRQSRSMSGRRRLAGPIDCASQSRPIATKRIAVQLDRGAAREADAVALNSVDDRFVVRRCLLRKRRVKTVRASQLVIENVLRQHSPQRESK
jgi:hypothetical protein